MFITGFHVFNTAADIKHGNYNHPVMAYSLIAQKKWASVPHHQLPDPKEKKDVKRRSFVDEPSGPALESTASFFFHG